MIEIRREGKRLAEYRIDLLQPLVGRIRDRVPGDPPVSEFRLSSPSRSCTKGSMFIVSSYHCSRYNDCGCGTGRRRSISASMVLTMAVLAPMPSASESTPSAQPTNPSSRRRSSHTRRIWRPRTAAPWACPPGGRGSGGSPRQCKKGTLVRFWVRVGCCAEQRLQGN